MIHPNVIIMWPGTNATIPSGFTRVTDLDGIYPKAAAAATEPNVTGGNANHTHTSSAHSHSMDSHTHTYNTNYSGSDGSDSDSGGSELNQDHNHTDTVAGLSGGGLSSVTSTYASFANDPPYRNVIFIKPSIKQAVPTGSVVLWYSATILDGFSICDGTGGTTDMRNKFLKGATTGGDGGGSGGTTTNIHDLTHTHTESSHSHAEWKRVSGNVGGGCRRGSGTGNRATCSHYHYFSLNGNTAGSISSVQLTTTETVEPAYKKVVAVAKTGTNLKPLGIIGMWLGTLATIPAAYHICDGTLGTPDLRGKFIKIANTTGEIGNTGGSDTHSHASQSHTHTGGSHSHTNASTMSSHFRHDQNGDTGQNGVGGGWTVMNKDRYHSTCESIGSNSVSWASGSTSGDVTTGEAAVPQYRTVAYVQYMGEKGGAFILNNLAAK